MIIFSSRCWVLYLFRLRKSLLALHACIRHNAAQVIWAHPKDCKLQAFSMLSAEAVFIEVNDRTLKTCRSSHQLLGLKYFAHCQDVKDNFSVIVFLFSIFGPNYRAIGIMKWYFVYFILVVLKTSLRKPGQLWTIPRYTSNRTKAQRWL